MELLGQECEFCCFPSLICLMQMVGEQRRSQEGVTRLGRPTEPRNQEDLALKFHQGKG